MLKEELKVADDTKHGSKLLPTNLQFFASNVMDGADDGTDDNSDADADDNAGGEGNVESKDQSAGASGEKTFKQSQVTDMMTREKRQGRNAALRELGINPKDAKMVQAVKEYIASQKATNSGESDYEAVIQEAEQRVLVAECKAESMIAGAKRQYVEDVTTLAMAKKTDESDWSTVFAELKLKFPNMFDGGGKDTEGDEDNKKGKGQKDDKAEEEKAKKAKGQMGTGSSIPNSVGNSKGKPNSLGARLAAQRLSQNNGKNSLFVKGTK